MGSALYSTFQTWKSRTIIGKEAENVTAQELIIYPAKLIRTMDPTRPTAEAVAVRGDRIRAVGSLEELKAYGEARIDDRYADSVLLPGFVEAHTHVFGGAMWNHTYVGYRERMSPDGKRWPGCESIDAIIERLREADAAMTDPEEPLTAWGLDPIFFPGERLDRRHLDQVSATRPIFVLHQSIHLATVNSALLQSNGITAETAVEGVAKDGAGEPTGELQEMPAIALAKSARSMLGDSAGFGDALRNFAADARNHGITTATDLANRYVLNDAMAQQMHAVVDAEDYPCRISVFHLAQGEQGGAEAARGVVARRESSTPSCGSAALSSCSTARSKDSPHACRNPGT
ncbi:MAG: amidohydrolase family protein [Cumulibacter sp.]